MATLSMNHSVGYISKLPFLPGRGFRNQTFITSRCSILSTLHFTTRNVNTTSGCAILCDALPTSCTKNKIWNIKGILGSIYDIYFSSNAYNFV